MTITPIDALRQALPVKLQRYPLPAGDCGLVIVDEVDGFCTVGAGNLAPQRPDPRIEAMVERTAALAHAFLDRKLPILAFLDTHEPGKPEPPYPPHCERGTGEENLVEALGFLGRNPDVTLIRKDCINGFVGAIEPMHHGMHGAHHNKVVDWVRAHRLKAIVTTGICVMDFVLTMLSARNHGMMPTLEDVVVLEPATATYVLPAGIVVEAGLPASATHPQDVTHHAALYFMASRGAVLASELARA